MAEKTRTTGMHLKAHKVFKSIAHELSNGKVLRLTDIFDILADQREEVVKLVKKIIHK